MSEVTQILQAIEHGDPHAAAQLLPLVYDELRQLAEARMSAERPDHTLNGTALVHEAYLRLAGASSEARWDNRRHFFAAAAEAMRRILVENARRKDCLKRGGGFTRVNLDVDAVAGAEPDVDIIALDAALERLAVIDPLKAKLVELRYFADLTGEEAAQVLGISPRTLDREWAYTRAWLLRELGSGG